VHPYQYLRNDAISTSIRILINQSMGYLINDSNTRVHLVAHDNYDTYVR